MATRTPKNQRLTAQNKVSITAGKLTTPLPGQGSASRKTLLPRPIPLTVIPPFLNNSTSPPLLVYIIRIVILRPITMISYERQLRAYAAVRGSHYSAALFVEK